MSAEEQPAGGGSWLGNALVYERNRCDCAEQAEQRGDSAAAEQYREFAQDWRRRRDREQREMEHRALNRRLRWRR